MPLKSGSDEATIRHNIEEMIASGHPQRVAVAAALHIATPKQRVASTIRVSKRGVRRDRRSDPGPSRE